MDHLIPRRFPCSVCGLTSYRHDGWFLVIENRWLDHLKILTWHSALATQREIKSACSREHLRLLIVHWLNQASLRLLPKASEAPVPIAGSPGRPDVELDPRSFGYLLGELSVHRETLSRGWTGSPGALECILDALIPVGTQSNARPPEYRLLDPSPKSSPGLALH